MSSKPFPRCVHRSLRCSFEPRGLLCWSRTTEGIKSRFLQHSFILVSEAPTNRTFGHAHKYALWPNVCAARKSRLTVSSCPEIGSGKFDCQTRVPNLGATGAPHCGIKLITASRPDDTLIVDLDVTCERCGYKLSPAERSAAGRIEIIKLPKVSKAFYGRSRSAAWRIVRTPSLTKIAEIVSMPPVRVLCIGNEKDHLRTRCAVLGSAGYTARSAATREAQILLRKEDFDLVIVSAWLSESERGSILSAAGKTPALVLTELTLPDNLLALVECALDASSRTA